TVGTMVLRFADADVLPYDFSDFADTIHKYSDELKTLLKNKQEEIRDRNQDLDNGVYTAASDPRRPTVAPPPEELPPFLNFAPPGGEPPLFLNFAPLDNAQSALERSPQRYAKAVKTFNGANASPQALQALNANLVQSERKLTTPDGLPRRSWFKHLIYAPGFY